MIELQFHPHWHNHREKLQNNGNNYDPCIICGKPSKNPKHYLRVFWSSHAVFDHEAKKIIEREGSGGDLLYYPLGTACLKKYPELKPYAEDAKRAMKESDNEDS